MASKKGVRRVGVLMVLVILAGFVPSEAAARGWGEASSSWSLWSRLWQWLGGWKGGAIIDPHGASLDAGSSLDPNGATLDNGADLDPNGRP